MREGGKGHVFATLDAVNCSLLLLTMTLECPVARLLYTQIRVLAAS